MDTSASRPGQVRRFRIRHETTFRYDRQIERSVHTMHLRPIHDWKQNVLEHRLNVEPENKSLEYEDAFGNWTTRSEVSVPYDQMAISANSVVELRDVDPFEFANLPIRPTFPLSWMPWDHKMLSPYLTPIELPGTQLTEIYDYAMSFVEHNHADLMESLFEINLAFFRDYKYSPGSTNLQTTPYDVLVNKHGVCQDFANLFICMARLLGVPARYVCGYVYTGGSATNPHTDATHAWVQLYIPNVGWKGFDPTNGVLPSTEHVRMAVGRHYRDTSPVSGTLYTMAQESMQTHVSMTEESVDGKPLRSPTEQEQRSVRDPRNLTPSSMSPTTIDSDRGRDDPKRSEPTDHRAA